MTTSFLCAEEQHSRRVCRLLSEVEVHAVPEGVEGIGDVGLVFVGFLGTVGGAFGLLVLLEAVSSLADAGLFHGDLQELVGEEVDSYGEVAGITLEGEVYALVLPVVAGWLADEDHLNLPAAVGEDPVDDIGVGLAGAAGLPDEGGVIVEDGPVGEHGSIVVSYLLHEFLELQGCLYEKAADYLHGVVPVLGNDGRGDGGV